MQQLGIEFGKVRFALPGAFLNLDQRKSREAQHGFWTRFANSDQQGKHLIPGEGFRSKWPGNPLADHRLSPGRYRGYRYRRYWFSTIR